MKLVSKDKQQQIQLKNSRRPKFNSHGGKSWDVMAKMTIDNQTIKIYADTTWGWCAYFEVDEKWYRMSVLDSENIRGEYTLERGNIE